MARPVQVARVHPTFRAFLRPMLEGHGRSQREMGRARAELKGEDPSAKEKHYGELFGRLLRVRPSKSRVAYPNAATLWHYADVFRYAGYRWVAGPVMLYAAGRLEEFVQVVAGTDLKRLPAAELRRLLEELPDAVEGGADAQRPWANLSGLLAEVFPEPAEAPKRIPKPPPDPIQIALQSARHFDMDYELQRRTVLDALKRWADEMIAKGNRAR